MSVNSKLILIIHNDRSVYRLLLIMLFLVSPALYYLCYDNTFSPLYLHGLNGLLCLVTIALTFSKNRSYYHISLYVTMVSFLVINNGVLLNQNNFAPLYMVSALIIFMALSFLCKKPKEFIALALVNAAVVSTAYFTSTLPGINALRLALLLGAFTAIAYITFIIRKVYRLKFKKAVDSLTQLNHTLVLNEQKLRDSRNQLHALINSINDIVFEVDENKQILNVWYNELRPLHFNPRQLLTTPLHEIIGKEKSQPFGAAIDFVVEHKKPTSLEFKSLFGAEKWFMAKVTPVFDREGNYAARISVAITDISDQKKYEQALKNNEELLLEAHAIAKLGNWWHDGYTKENYWSGNLYKLLEINEVPEGIEKFQYYISLVHPDDIDNTRKFYADISANANKTFEHKLITPGGNLKYIKVVKGDTLFDKEGKLRQISGVLQDITEIRLSEKSAKVSRAELIEAQTIARIGNWNLDVNSKRLSWSDEINNVYENPRATNTANNYMRIFLKYVHPDDKYILKKLVKSPENATNISYEYRIITPKGKIKHLSIIVGKLLTRDGRVRKIIGTIQDVSVRKKAELEYKRSENKYKLVLESVKLAAVTVDNNGIITFCNRHLAGLLGYDQHEIIGQHWINKFIPDNLKEHLGNWITHRTVKAHFIHPVICRNGDQRVISWQNTVTFDELGNIREITAIGEDVTDQQKATQELITAKEDAERSSHFKSEFLSTMSHEIRTPMNAVIGTTNLLLSENPRPEQLEYLNTLKFSGENLLAIINDILDYNKIEAGKLELNPQPVNLQQLAQKISQAFLLRARQQNIQLILETDPTLPEFIMADQGRLSQILNNLVGNAVKFTGKGSVTIKIDKTEQTDRYTTIKFTIADTGIGIAPENLEVIFDPFIQEGQVNSNYGGTGLGLAITRRLIELHNSSIEVKSELNKGTQFAFTIHFEIVTVKQDTTLTPYAGETLLQDLTGMRILVVDDNKMNLFIASKFLKKWHAKVDEALNGKIAVDMVENNIYDLIIMDLQMPVMDGFKATEIIRKKYPNLPVIALTADAMPETHSKAFIAGINDYLTKPFKPETLFEKVSKHRERENLDTA